MSMIPDEVIEQVRDSADLVGLIGEAVNLKRTGSDYRGPCPFHGGKGRNFAVIPKRAMYYCFVCHESGDVFRWLMKRFGMDYPTAVRDVARRSGIVIPESTSRAGPDPLEPLYGVVAAAQDWFARQLLERPETVEMLLAGQRAQIDCGGELAVHDGVALGADEPEIVPGSVDGRDAVAGRLAGGAAGRQAAGCASADGDPRRRKIAARHHRSPVPDGFR